jgi:hypothetical protein
LCNIDPELLSYITNEEFGNLAINDNTKNAIATVIKYRYVLCVVLVSIQTLHWKSSQYSVLYKELQNNVDGSYPIMWMVAILVSTLHCRQC